MPTPGGTVAGNFTNKLKSKAVALVLAVPESCCRDGDVMAEMGALGPVVPSYGFAIALTSPKCTLLLPEVSHPPVFLLSFGVFEDNNIDGCERAAGPRSGVEISCFSQSEETLCLLDSDNLSRRR
ncbi:hypothetical protein Anapl_03303 [Anas platyrhynchos]|uniref:Uncharacterized protein n=1 Tax=Anas platyrhynchos TaxID=8839 RepID=R0JRC4_ANAPL|nr:hypothetical protein Anapl_03303 [Anas platyrhynchos]